MNLQLPQLGHVQEEPGGQSTDLIVAEGTVENKNKYKVTS
jgi:hypothetical protein